MNRDLLLATLAILATLAACGSGDDLTDFVRSGSNDDDSTAADDDDTTDDDDATDDDDSTLWPEGFVTGIVRNDPNKEPVPGVVVSARGSNPFVTTTTNEDGEFEMTVNNDGDLDLQLVKAGYQSTLIISTVEAIDLEFIIFETSKAWEAYPEDFGIPFDPTKALVKVEPRGSNSELEGFTADLSCDYSSVWVVNGNDEFVPGNTILGDGKYGEIVFVGVEPGGCQVTFSPPTGVSCECRTELDVPTNFYLLVPAVCDL